MKKEENALISIKNSTAEHLITVENSKGEQFILDDKMQIIIKKDGEEKILGTNEAYIEFATEYLKNITEAKEEFNSFLQKIFTKDFINKFETLEDLKKHFNI